MKILKVVTKIIVQYFQFSGDDDTTTFDDLDWDCVYLILNELDFDDLANAAQVNKKLSMFAADLFRLKYLHFQFVIGDGFHLSPSETQIQLKNDDQILSNAFRSFGHLMKRLKLMNENQEHSVQWKLIGKLINEYSSKALREIEIESKSQEILQSIDKPLINVEIVTFANNDMNFTSKNVRIHEIFPAVRRLNLNSLTDCGLAYFNHHMPHLKHISVRNDKGLNQFNFSSVSDIFIKNPQVQSISLHRADPNYLPELNKLFPKLETLSLTQIEVVYFTTENSLQVGFSFAHPFDNLVSNFHFTQLQNLEIDHTHRFHDQCVSILNVHKHLRRLSLRHYDLNDLKFQQLTQNLKNLTEITLTLATTQLNPAYVSSSAIVNFLRNNEKVKKFNVINYPKNCEDSLQEQLRQEWNTRIIDGGLSFERINQF